MANLECRLLSKVIDTKDIAVLHKYNIDKKDMATQQDTLEFIQKYYKEFGTVPAFTEVVAECPNFEYEAEVLENPAYMCKKIKSDVAKRKAFNLLQKEATANFSKMNGTEFVEWLAGETAFIKEVTACDVYAGTNYATNGEERKEWYMDSKESRTYSYIPTPYATLTEYLGGGFELGDYVTVMAYTNRGKSFIATQIGQTAWRCDYGVLHYSPELSKRQQMQRLDTMDGHFRNSEMKIGQLRDEEKYLKYLDQFNGKNETPYIVKTMGDLPKGLGLDTIEADLQSNDNIKMVIIDGFNLMNHKGKNGNRDNMTNTSRKLRQLFAKYGVVGIVIHQTPTSAEKNKGEDETGARIVEPPSLTDYSETVAIIQDSCTVLTFDQADGVGKLKLAKCRTPNVDKMIELHCDFDIGMIREVSPVDFI